MDLGLADAAVVVTGASRGIGRAIAAGFIEERARVMLCARGVAQLDATAVLLRAAYPGATVSTVAADVGTPEGAESIVEAARREFGGLDVLVNNAGANIRDGSPVENFERSYALNAVAPARLMEAAKPLLLQSSRAAVVNISSIYGRESGGPGPYNASKAAQIAMTKAYALDWIRQGIRVNNVAPGSIAFDGGSWGRRLVEEPEAMAAFVAQNIAGGRFGTPEEVARVVVFLGSPRASWLVGTTINVDGGQSRSNI